MDLIPTSLNFAGTVVDKPGFRWLNNLACDVHARIVVPWLRNKLEVKDVFLRRSVLYPPEFNIFYSDVDLGFIIEGEEELPKIRSDYEKLKKTYRFLGEVEIYTESEISELKSLLIEYDEIYSLFRDLRKVGWMERIFISAVREYDRQKYVRSIEKSLERIGSNQAAKGLGNLTDIGSILNNFFEKAWIEELIEAARLGVNQRGQFVCPYWGRRLQYSPQTEGGPDSFDFSKLHLSSEHALLLLALTPPLVRDHIDNAPIDRLRQMPKIKATLHGLSRIEFLIYQAVYRNIPMPEFPDTDWLQLLAHAATEIPTETR